MAKTKSSGKMEPANKGKPAPHVVKVGPKGVITIPEENRTAMGIQPGQYLTTMQVGSLLILSPEINRFLDLTSEFQQKLATAGLTADTVMSGLDETRSSLFQRLYGDSPA